MILITTFTLIGMKQETAQPLNGEPENNSKFDNQNDMSISNSAHPFACIFTFAFKGAAFLMYLLPEQATSF